MIEVNNLVKRYGNHTAVDHLSFKIEKGKIYGFLGPNGAGKSTTMNMITGYIASTEGTVKIDGHDILEEPEAAKKCIGYLPEQPPVYFDMTVLEYMKFVADLKKIPKAVEEICNSLDKKPSVVMICITCVDALLGTDMERVCRKAEEAAGLPVRPCYMYALTREGRKPPMVHVRQSLYSLLEPRKKKGNVVNLLGFFSPLVDDCELYDLLHQAGVKTIHEISVCRDYEEYQTMSEANFNLVLHPEARFAAEDFHDRLKIPYIELRRLYQIDKIASQYRAFAAALGVEFEDEIPRKAAEEAVEKFRKIHPDAVFAVGEWMNGDPFELALALVHYGFRVSEIYGTLSGENFVYVKQLAKISPDTKVFSNLEPTMLYYDKSQSGVNMTIGKDAGYYHKECSNVLWNEERQPYGYAGVRRLFEALAEV